MSIIPPKMHIVVDVSLQSLVLYQAKKTIKTYAISTAVNGVGETEGSGCTPRGRHIIDAKIGYDLPIGSVLVGRVPTGEIYSASLAAQYPDRDWILSRILWLSGQEEGFNFGCDSLGRCCDTKQRYIYIHGTPDTEPMGIAKSHGCIRMHNADIVDLFGYVEEGMCVNII